jgi:Tfp pilus assembly protein PilF
MIKKLIYISILFISCANFSFAQPQNARLEYNSPEYIYRKFNIKQVLGAADIDMLLFQKTKSVDDQKKYLSSAMKNYYIASKINKGSIDANLGIARVYDIMNLDVLAKEYFSKSINIDNYNPKANCYFGDFYYRRDEYLRALFYYKVAYKYGYSKNYELNLKLGIIYEKLGDIESAKAFYSNALRLQPRNSELLEKIRLLDELNYGNSQYYLFKR